MHTPSHSRKRARDLQESHACYAVHDHVAYLDTDLRTYISENKNGEAEEDTSPTPSVSSSSAWKRRRVLKQDDDNEFELEYLDSVPPSPWIHNHRQPSPLELTACTTPNEEQDLPKERKRYREEWEELKGLYIKALGAYGASLELLGDPREALDILRHVIEECHEFLVVHKDPSILFSPLVQKEDGTWSPQNLSGPDQRLFRNWSESASASVSYTAPNEHPTAFHTVCGSALLCFGILLAKFPSLGPLAKTYGPDWSGTDYYYWLCALDVLEAGDSLPNRSRTVDSVTYEDWRMSVAFGFALVCLARAVQKRTQATKHLPPTDKPLLEEEPRWPPGSPFHPNTMKPPLTRRLQLQRASAHELMLLAQDHFYRCMFYMPRSGWSPAGLFNNKLCSLPVSETLAATVGTGFLVISAEILSVSEGFEEPSERQRWAQLADVVLNALRGVEDKRLRARILLASGKCKVASGFAKMQGFGVDFQQLSPDMLSSHRAQYARKTLSAAITVLEQANCEEARDLLIKALKYSGDLCTSPGERSQFYARAKALCPGNQEVTMDVDVPVFN